MATCLVTCWMALTTPLLPPAGTSQLTMNDPSTLELALIGVGTFAAYSAAKRWLSLGKDNIRVSIEVVPDESGRDIDQRAREPSRGAA